MIGELVGPYRVLELLGSGGMGEVYLADDPRLGRRVALKRPSDAWLALPDARARLHHEARAAAALTHPNIAAIHDVLDVGANPYIVMEYVEGETLASALRRGALRVERVVEIGAQLADALAAAHAKGIVHRDLKPANVSVTPDGQVKILDFGLATARNPAGDEGATGHITVPGLFMGTPGYASPEQLAGKQPSPADDIYSLGVLLFELLTGRGPFDEKDALNLAVATMTRTAPLVETLNPQVPRELSALIARALARDARDRIASAAQLRAELRRAGEALAANPTIGFDDVAPRRRKHLVPALMAIGLLALGGIVFAWLRVDAPPASAEEVPVIAVLPFESLSQSPGDAAIATGMRDVLIANLVGHPGINVLSRTATAESGLDRTDIKKLARSLGATYLVDGSVQRAGGDLLVVVNLVRGDSGYVERSDPYSASEKDVLSLQARIAEGLTGAPPLGGGAGKAPRAARSGPRDVQALELLGQAVSAMERPDIPGNLHRSEQLLLAVIERDPGFALAWARLGETYWALYESTRDTAWADQATKAIYEALRLDRDQPRVWLSLAIIHHGTGRSDVALEELDQALALQPSSDDARRVRGQVLQALGRPDEAVEEYRSAIRLRPSYWRNYNALGALYYATGRHDDAIGAFTRVTELQPDSARGFHNLGTVYYIRGDHDRALEYYAKAVAVSPMPETYSALGNIHYYQGRYEAAADSFRSAIKESPNKGLLHGNLGDAYAQLNRREQARAAYLEAVRLEAQALRVNPKDAAALARLAVGEAKLGRRREAERNAGRAVELARTDAEVLYRSAVVHTLNGNATSALADLEQALKYGFSAALAAQDHDLAALRETARFGELIATP